MHSSEYHVESTESVYRHCSYHHKKVVVTAVFKVVWKGIFAKASRADAVCDELYRYLTQPQRLQHEMLSMARLIFFLRQYALHALVIFVLTTNLMALVLTTN